MKLDFDFIANVPEGYTDVDFMRVAYQMAQDSPDPSTQNGAILVDDQLGYILLGECNRFPDKVEYKPERWERPGKYFFVEHAERNVILAAAKFGYHTEGTIMYCPWYACADCARAIIQAGIKEVVGHKTLLDMSYNQWPDTIKAGADMMTEAGIKMRWFEGTVGASIRFNGKVIEV